jgi:hypothetical protein
VSEPTDRRQFFTRLVRVGAQAVQEVAAAGSGNEAAPSGEPPPAPVLVQPRAVAHTASVGELLTLADDEGLQRRHGALVDLARPSVRITPTGEGDAIGAQVEGGAEPDGSHQTWRPLAHIQLADPALSASRLPSTGRLIVLVKNVRETALRGRQCTEARVMFEPDTPDKPSFAARDGRDEAPAGFAGRLSAELTLPRVWAAAVQRLELDEDEHEGYVRLRRRLAELQGVVAEEGGGHDVADHRLLGYPTETSGAMPLLCEVAARGLDAAPAVPDRDLLAGAERWRLLLQVTRDERSGIVIGDGVERIYCWIADEDLRAGAPCRLWAFFR